MKNLFLLFLLIGMVFLRVDGWAVEKASSSKKQAGGAAKESTENSLKWGIGAGASVAFITAFGLIIYWSSTDPTTFTHNH